MASDTITLFRPIDKIAKAGAYSSKLDKVGLSTFAYM